MAFHVAGNTHIENESCDNIPPKATRTLIQ